MARIGMVQSQTSADRAGTRKLSSGGIAARSARDNGARSMLNTRMATRLTASPTPSARARRQGTRASSTRSGPTG